MAEKVETPTSCSKSGPKSAATIYSNITESHIMKKGNPDTIEKYEAYL